MRSAMRLLLIVAIVVLPIHGSADDPSENHATSAPNRLRLASSPYLLEHQHDPIDWYPWGAEALEKAKAEGKLLFVSVGYASCHWCHVMQKETFRNEEVAQFLNGHYICVKVDREERPDVDVALMTALQTYHQLSGQPRGGGWPMSMFLTPDVEPFFGATYLPPHDGDRGFNTGFLTVIQRIQETWSNNPEKIQADAALVARVTKRELEQEGETTIEGVPPFDRLAEKVIEAFETTFDERYGGFGAPRSPKFPESPNLAFLERFANEGGNERARHMWLLTLNAMAKGGIRDHLGGGFHRYTVDSYWEIPHFEKMLYDNAQLLSAYARAFQATGDVQYREVAEQIVTFVERDLTAPDGAFYSSLDADSAGEEGSFYRWTSEEIQSALSPDEWTIIRDFYRLEREPNFEGRFFVLTAPWKLSEFANEKRYEPEDLRSKLATAHEKLLARRAGRPRPKTDTKILTGWNGLMIAGLADTAVALKEKRYSDLASRAADSLLQRVKSDDGGLWASYPTDSTKIVGYQTDYAFLAYGFLRLSQATGERRWLEEAERIAKEMLKRFASERGGLYLTAEGTETPLARSKDWIDGAMPGGNTVAVKVLSELALASGNAAYLEDAEKILKGGVMLMERSPLAVPDLILSVDQWEKAKRVNSEGNR